MLYKLFLKYWKLSTWCYKPIGPYYRWLWRSPGKKFLIMLVISTISTVIQFKLLEKWLARNNKTEPKKESFHSILSKRIGRPHKTTNKDWLTEPSNFNLDTSDLEKNDN